MAIARDFSIHSSYATGREVVTSALKAQGCLVTSTPSGGLLAKRGGTAATVCVGSLSGKSYQLVFTVEFKAASDGRLVARLGLHDDALTGRDIQDYEKDTVFQKTADAVCIALRNAGLLAEAVPQR